jgi:dUTP pyrophosphatase
MGWFSKRKEPEPLIQWHIPEGRDDLIPRAATDGSMALDLISPETLVIPAVDYDLGVGSALINTLVAATIPNGYAMVIRSRSGLAAHYAITAEAGEIDTDYRGLIRVLLYNHGGEDYVINSGDRIAQIRFVKVYELNSSVSYEYPDPDETDRGVGGIGSTGK